MRISRIEFPPPLIAALRSRELVVFAGTGVSMASPANMPNFAELTDCIAAGTGKLRGDQESEDRFLGTLADGGVDVHKRTMLELQARKSQPTDQHRSILRLFGDQPSVRLVTTNFDVLFEEAAKNQFKEQPKRYCAPALPTGRNFHGIVHVHGSVEDHTTLVVTDRDFGRAYLAEGWARRFLFDVFRHSTVLFIGYSHNDTILQYLARAIPEHGVGKRYALAGEKESLDWQRLGIEPLVFPQASTDDYTALADGLTALATLVGRNVLDWRFEIRQVASKPPTLSDEETTIVEYALDTPTTTRFFIEAATSDWINWLERKGFLEHLVTADELPLCERDAMLAQWLVQRLKDADQELLLFLARHQLRIHPHLWNSLCWELGYGTSLASNPSQFLRWARLMIASIPPAANLHLLVKLGARCGERGDHRALLKVFSVLTEIRPRISDALVPVSGPTNDSRHGIDVEIRLTGGHHSLFQPLEKELGSSLHVFAEELLVLIHRRLEDAHELLSSWGKADREWDPLSFRRSAIERHRQDQFPQPIDLLINAGRDSLAHLANADPPAVGYWCPKLLKSDVPLLRRLAVYAIALRTDMSPDEKLSCLGRAHVHSNAIHHEVFRLAQLVYPMAGHDSRVKLLDHVLESANDDASIEDVAYQQFNWLHWLCQADPECKLARTALDRVQARNPSFQPREFPDLTHWIGEFESGPISPWSVEELLAQPGCEWLQRLVALPANAGEWRREGIHHAVTDAARQNFEWGQSLADALRDESLWSSDLWAPLMRAWSDAGVNAAEYLRAFEWICTPELQRYHQHAVAGMLEKLVRNGGTPYAPQLLQRANSVATGLWEILDPPDPISSPSDEWLQQAINAPAGLLAEFWVGSLVLSLKAQHLRSTALADVYQAGLMVILDDRSINGTMGRSVLCATFAVFLAVDEAWAKTNLLPLFEITSGDAEFDAAWDGFLTWGRLNPAVGEAMEPTFLRAVEHLENRLSNNRDRFVHYCTPLIAYFSKDPLKHWIPAFFSHASIHSRCTFASELERFFEQTDELHHQEVWNRWLKAYWLNRLNGVPAPLAPEEIERMLRWLLHFTTILPDAIEIACLMPTAPMNDMMYIYEIRTGDLPHREPAAIARLAVHLASCPSPTYVEQELLELIRQLLEQPLPEELELKLREIVARLGGD